MIIPKGIVSIGDYGFGECVNLTGLIVPDTIKEIGTEVFWSCESLKRLEIPKNVAVMEERCFYTSGIKELVLHSVKIRLSEGVFEGVDVERVLVPKESKNLFLEFFEDTDVEVEGI